MRGEVARRAAHLPLAHEGAKGASLFSRSRSSSSFPSSSSSALTATGGTRRGGARRIYGSRGGSEGEECTGGICRRGRNRIASRGRSVRSSPRDPIAATSTRTRSRCCHVHCCCAASCSLASSGIHTAAVGIKEVVEAWLVEVRVVGRIDGNGRGHGVPSRDGHAERVVPTSVVVVMVMMRSCTATALEEASADAAVAVEVGRDSRAFASVCIIA